MQDVFVTFDMEEQMKSKLEKKEKKIERQMQLSETIVIAPKVRNSTYISNLAFFFF